MHAINDETEKGCILVFITLFSFLVFLYSFYTTYMYCGLDPKNNSTVDGVIVKSSIEKSRLERRGYSIDIEYEYRVEGEK